MCCCYSCLVLVLGVKTHFVTLAISLIFISIYLNRVMFRHAFIGCLLLAVFALSTEVGSDRIMVLYEQLFEGGYQAIESREGGAWSCFFLFPFYHSASVKKRKKMKIREKRRLSKMAFLFPFIRPWLNF